MRKKDANKSVEKLCDRILAFIANEVQQQGICDVAKRAGVTRQALYRVLQPGANPQIKTVLTVLRVLGFQLGLRPISGKSADK